MGSAPEELSEPPHVIKGVITDMALPSKQLLRYWGVGLTKHIPNPSLGCVIFWERSLSLELHRAWAREYLWFLLLKLNTDEGGKKESHCIKNKQFWGVETSRNISSALVIVHGHVLVPVSPQGSFMAWRMESAERTGLCRHMDPFLVTNPIHWHLELPFREIFARSAV